MQTSLSDASAGSIEHSKTRSIESLISTPTAIIGLNYNPGHNINLGGLQMEKYERYVYIIIIAILLLVPFSGCGVKSLLQQRAPVKAEIVRKADWEVEFRDVFFSMQSTVGSSERKEPSFTRQMAAKIGKRRTAAPKHV